MKKVIFLDRDGVINKFPGYYKYVESESGFEFLPGSLEAISLLTRSGYDIFVVSNQAGVTKGIYSQQTLDNITEIMLREIESNGGKIKKVLYCIHTDDQKCGCRKPKTGLITEAIRNIDSIDLRSTFLVGDSIRDMKTGKAAGCKTILVLSGRAKIENKAEWELQPDFIVRNLLEATDIILSQTNSK